MRKCPTAPRRAARALRAMLLAFAMTVPLPTTALAQQGLLTQDRDYQVCMQRVTMDPSDAFEFALAWADRGGGFAAKHCEASALFALGQYGEAAARLQALAAAMEGRAPAPVLGDLLGHAGVAWLQAGETERAHAAQTSALALDPANVQVRIDRAMTLAAAENWWEAIDDLNLALEAAPDDVTARVLRGGAYRQVEVFDLALEDLNRALQLQPGDGEALLERGIVKRLQNRPDEARADWLEVLRLHEGRPAADMARRNLELLDVEAGR